MKQLLGIIGLVLINLSLRQSITGVALPQMYRQMLLESGISSKRNLLLGNTLNQIWAARELIVRGKYSQGTTQLKEIYNEVYEMYGISQSQGSASRLLSIEWSWAFGHIGNAAVYLRLRELEGDFRRHVIFAENTNRRNELLKNLGRKHDIVFLQEGEQKWSVTPGFWPFVQQQDILFLGNGNWMRPERYYDTKYPELLNAELDPPIKLEFDEINHKKRLLKMSREDEWFCTLHVRNSKDDSIRNQNISDYLEAIDYIKSKGGTVYLLGSYSDEVEIHHPGLIDLRSDQKVYNEVQPFLISQSRFMIGSSGGPIIMPKVFGVPSLITNIVNYGWCATSGPKHTYYLPKIIKQNGSRLSYAQSLRCDLVWGDFQNSWLRGSEFEIINNSPLEILKAVSFMIEVTEPNKAVKEITNKSIDKARSEFDWVASGSIVPTFLEENSWYLS